MRRRTEAVRPSDNPDPAAFLPLPNLPYLVMLSIAEQPRHGWAIIKRIEELNGPRAAPSSGSLYLAIARLEERGLIEESPSRDASADQRRTYRLTALGRRVVRLETARLSELVGLAKRWLGPEPDR
ncbi:MAG TPA: PadR family transcriptional regulator [Gemmatimonadaceae bacterium]|nr:PadR family transcriptional regulator [Gemmatimonadaceae bacterium]